MNIASVKDRVQKMSASHTSGLEHSAEIFLLVKLWMCFCSTKSKQAKHDFNVLAEKLLVLPDPYLIRWITKCRLEITDPTHS